MRRTMLIAMFVLAACSGAEKEPEEEGVFDPLVKTIDKAEDVEDAALKHKEEMDRRLREMEGADSSDDE